MSFDNDDDLGDLNDEELERELRELQAIEKAVNAGAGGRRSGKCL